MQRSTPQGFRDVIGEEARERERVIRAVQDRLSEHGFAPIETPTLESMDTLTAGGRMHERAFRFFDASGDLLAMRPDVTMQVARMCSTRLAAAQEPLRLRYVQRVFREAHSLPAAEAREFTQIGVECIGAAGAAADAELIELLVGSLRIAGVGEVRLALATVSVLRALLAACGAAPEWCEGVLAAFHTSNFVELARLTSSGAAEAQVPPVFAQAIAALPALRGGRESIERARELVAPLGCEQGLSELEEVWDILAGAGLEDCLLVDFSQISSFDYYTGIVFCAYSPHAGRPLGSGGRYDAMLGAYGSARPAAGFAFSLEAAMGVAGERSEGERPLRIAVPKGSLNADAIAALAGAGLDVAGLADPGRSLIIRGAGVEYVIVRPTDAPAFVASGAADCGICGKDSLLEAELSVVELVDLGFGACRFVVAQPTGARQRIEERHRRVGSIRVATKYPRITRAHFARAGQQVEVVKLHGNIELAPLTGLAERIVDITATGTTLRENDLEVVEEVLSSTARFLANPCALRTDPRVADLARRLSEGLES